MRVDLRRRDVRVPEHELQAAKVRAAFQQVRREAVPQHMRTEPLGNPGRQAIPAQQFPERLPGHRRAARGHEQELRRRLLENGLPEASSVVLDRLERGSSDGNQTRFPSLAVGAHNAHFRVQFRQPNRNEFRHPQARGVQQLQHGQIPAAQSRFRVGGFQQLVDLGARQVFGQGLPLAWRRKPGRGVLLDPVLVQEVPIEAPEAAEVPADRPRAQAFREQSGHELAQIRAAGLRQFQPAVCEKALQALQIRAIGRQAVRRQPLLDAGKREELLQRSVHLRSKTIIINKLRATSLDIAGIGVLA